MAATRSFKVYGNVRDSQSNVLPGLLVRAFDRDLRSEQLLGEILTDDDGHYEIIYTVDKFSRVEKRNADLAIKVFLPSTVTATNATGKLLYEPSMDDIFFNAPFEALINITITTAIISEENEFEALIRNITPLMDTLGISALRENKDLRDITFLQKETGLDGLKLEYLALAHRLSDETKMDAAFFYALLRKNTLLKLDPAQSLNARIRIDINTEIKPLLYDIVLADEKIIQQDVLNAIKELIIPARIEKALPQIMVQLKRYADEAKKYQQGQQKQIVTNLIGNFILADKVSALQGVLDRSKHNYSELFTTISGPDFFKSDADAAQAKANVLLAEVLGFNSRLIGRVKDAQKIEKPSDLKKLASLDRAGWKEMLSSNEMKGNSGGDSGDDKLMDFQASLLVRSMEKQFPSAAFAAQLQREKSAKLSHHDAIVKLFSAHEDFDLQKSNVDLFFKSKNLNSDENDPVKDEIKSLQRVFKLVPHYAKTNALLQKNIRSAQSIVATGQSRFVQEIAPQAGISKKEATGIYQRAENTNIAAMLIAGELQDLIGSTQMAALKTPSLGLTLEAVSKDFPNITSLFKLTDLCACDHCRSVFSPAAYLVEILQFLDKRTVVDLTTTPHTTAHLAKDVLFSRRPDLGDIDLGCENAEMPLPYIDLVCELLEEIVFPDPGILFNGAVVKGKISNPLLTALVAAKVPVTDKAVIFEPDVNGDFILRDDKAVCKIIKTGLNTWKVKVLHQTLSTAEELGAAPEYVNLKAYDVLKNSKFAFNLPFDLNSTEANAYFTRFGIPHSKLMEDFQTVAGPADAKIAADKLGLNDAEHSLIVTADNINQQVYWNTSPANAVDKLKVVDEFLDKSGLSYNDLDALLHLKFINPADKLFIKHLDTSCDTLKKEIANLDADALDRLHRFLRLQKKLGWKPAVVNEMIMQSRLGAGKLDDNCLIMMANLLRLNEKTGIKLEELIGFYGEIPHDEVPGYAKKTLYQTIFLNKATSGFIEEGLLPAHIDGTKQLADFATTLALGVQIPSQDFDRLVATFSNTSLTFANLSLLYAVTKLSKKLKLKIPDYLLYKDLTGLDIFASPAVTLTFVEHIEKAKASPLKIADVKFMLVHDAENLSDREITDARITDFLQKLQSSYQKAFDTNRSPFDPLIKADELKEAVSNLLSKLPQITATADDEVNFKEEDVKNFLRMIDRQWVSPPDPLAGAYIDLKLGSFFDVTNIKTEQNNLATAVPITPDYDFESERMALMKSILSALSAYFYAKDKTDALLTALVTAFKTDEEVLTAVLAQAKLKQPAPGTALIADILSTDALIDSTNLPPAPPLITALAFPDQFRAIRLLHKVLPLLGLFKLEVPDIEWLLTNSHSLGWFEFDSIPYEGAQTAIAYSKWEDFLDIIALSKDLSPVPNAADAENPVTFFSVLALLLPAATTTRSEWLDAFALLTGYDPDQLDDIDLYFNYSVPDLNAYTKPATWLRIQKCMDELRILGVSVADVKEFIKPGLTADDTKQLRMALKARYDETLWLDTLKEIMDVIRDKKRDALVAYLLATNPQMKDENDLFDFLLVDVQMEACMPSSRIVQAHGTIQLFAQRCLLGLEPKAAADVSNDKSWDQWKWMKNYRVWEANRKVFLYPENWIEPELLDQKSYLFSDLENELLQDEVNDFTTEDALIRYVEKLDDIAFLEVVATYEQTDIYTMHVFARTKGGDPATYYYRTFEKERVWTPWVKVELDISGDHLLAFVRNNRLCLAWPVFSDIPDPDPQGDVPDINSPGTKPVAKPKRKLKIQLAISEFANNKWKPKKVSKQGIETPNSYTSDPIPRNIYNLMYNQFGEQIMIFHTTLSNNFEYHTTDGIFDITGCKGYPELVSTQQTYFPDFFPDFKDSLLAIQRYTEQGHDATNDLSVRNAISFFNFYELLRVTPGTFRLTYPHQFTLIDLVALLYQLLIMNSKQSTSAFVGNERHIKLPLGTLLPYFFEDSAHSYVIIPGFYTRSKDKDTGEPILIKRTYSDTLKLVEDIIALYVKYITKLQADPAHDVAKLLQQLVADPEFQRIVAEVKVYSQLKYGEQFKNMYHPLLCMLRKTLYKDGVPALMKRETQLFVNTNFNFNTNYSPNTAVVPAPFPIEDLDFSSDGSYSSYNWEMFYHIPLMLATRLTANQKFEEALVWFHYMFNPTGALEGTVPQKFWVTKPFYLRQSPEYIAQRIDTLLTKIADPTTPERNELEFAIEEWRDKPFQPHVVARFRTVAYQKVLLMKYIDNLMEWGDNLFRQDTMESVTQATQMYILADKLLGPKPRIIPAAVKVPYETYNQIEAKLDAFGNALIEFENLIPDLSVLPHKGQELPPPPITLSSLYFCIPPNENMLAYWDRIADRLFNIRHCRNIDGVERSLALFAPPIDPGALVRAAAAGLDISSVLAGLSAPLPNYRFSVLSQKATELTTEIRGLGSALLTALEKKDGEALALLRSELEMKVLKAVRDYKKLQIDEAKEQIEVLKKTRETTQERDSYYTNIKKIIPNEQLNLDKIADAQTKQEAAQGVQLAASIMALIPDIDIGASGFGGSPIAKFKFGGINLAQAAKAASDVLQFLSLIASNDAARASINGSFDRRFDDWKLQERLAKKELKQIDQQIEAAKIRQLISETDLKNHDLQIENAKKTDEFMKSKYTNKQLYDWMIGKISAVYFRAYKLAYDVAKKAERCYQHELGNTDTFLQFGYWDSLKKGLQSADLLYHDIKRMELSYYDKNKREYELTKHVSVSLLDPLTLVRLKATGACDFEIPEAAFDMDYPGQYFRRIKSVSISIPCIAGPYTSVSAKLSLVSNKYRKNALPGSDYAEDPGNDDRFTYNVGAIQSVAASNAQNDSGLFELNFRDERYLPFEGCGAISKWRLELPKEVRQFDYNTISEVIIHVKYTAREGGSSLRALAEGTLKDQLNAIKQQLNNTGLHMAFNMRYDMSNEWQMLKSNGTVNLQITKDRLPYFAKALDTTIDSVIFIAKVTGNPATISINVNLPSVDLNKVEAWSLCMGTTNAIALDTAFDLSVPPLYLGNLEELMIVVKYVVN